MLNSIILFSLRYRLLIMFISVAALIYGSYTAATLPIDVFPDLDRPRVVIMTECPGYAAEDVETLVTFPIESAVNGATGVESVRSQSAASLSVVYVDFGWDTNIYRARQIVQERLNMVHLPDEITPTMAPISSLMGQIMMIGMHRRPGPNGGELTDVGDSNFVAELTWDAKDRRVGLYVWRTRDAAGKRISDPAKWQLVSEPASSATLRVDEGAKPLALQPTEGSKLTFTGVLPKSDTNDFNNLDRVVELDINSQHYRVEFPSSTRAQMELRTLADWVVRLGLLNVKGVAQVITMGGGRKQYQVRVDADALNRYKIGLDDITKPLQQNNVNSSAGWATRGDKEKPIRFLGRLGAESGDVLAEIGAISIKKTAQRNVTLKEVARVIEAPQSKRGDVSVNGFPGVTLAVTKQPHVDTRDLSDRVEKMLKDLESSLPPDVVIRPEIFQLRRFIDIGVYNVAEALVLGAVLVIAVLFLFLLNFRTTFISLTAIPLSLVTTILTFRFIGWVTGVELSINVMTLGGIAVAMGELVDDSIVDVENIFRRLRLNNVAAEPRPVMQVIYDASVEIRSAIVFGTILVILVFIPLFFLSGVEGRLFTPLGIAYIVSILASLLISLTVTPVLSFYLLPNAKATHHQGDSFLLRVLKAGASVLIRFSIRHTALILIVTWLMVGGAVFVLTQLGSNFLPPFDEGSVQVNVTLPSGSSLEASNRVCALVDAKFRTMQKSEKNPKGEILAFARRSGRAELDEHVEPPSNSEYILTINPESGHNRDELRERILKELRDLNLGADLEVEQPLAHLISHMLSGVTAQLAIKIHGDDLTQLKSTAEKIKQAISDVPGILPPVVEPQQLSEELHIRPKKDALALYNIDREHLSEFIRTVFYGETVGQVFQNERRFDLVVRLDEPQRMNYDELGRLLVYPEDGGAPLPLSTLAYIDDGLGANVINRENVRRRIVVRVNAIDRDLGSVVADVKQRVRDNVELPQGYFVEYGGQFESQQRATLTISVLALLSMVAMFVVLYMLYPSSAIVLQILHALPVAFIGGVLALWVTRQTLTVAGMVGFISLAGIAARNGILLVSHYFHLMKHEGESFTPDMILRGSLERLSPVLMTALTAIIALIPLVIAGHEPGREILYPVATVIVGGMLTSTLCEFLIHPGLFWRFSGKSAERIAAEVE